MAWQLDRYCVGTDSEIKLSTCTSEIACSTKQSSSGASLERAEKASGNQTSCRGLKTIDVVVREFNCFLFDRRNKQS
jgi:hypothetical protein